MSLGYNDVVNLPATSTMRAISYSRYGPPEVLSVVTVDVPVPRPNEVRIRVRAVEVTKGDCELRSFRFPVKWFWLPLRLALGVTRPRRRILGGYFAGEVETCGEAVTKFAPGDEVYGATGLGLGAYAEFVCLSERAALAPKPTTMTFAEAAAVPLGGLNALHFMRTAGIQGGESVLIVGAGGSIGLHALQIAKSAGATVTVVDGGHKEELLRRFGADEFLDYEEIDFTTRPETYDVIFDMVPTTPYRACIGRLAHRGRYVCGNPRLSVMIGCAWTNWFTSESATFAFAPETSEALSELAEFVDDGRIASIVDGVYRMEDIAAAHRRVETEQRLGAVVVAVE